MATAITALGRRTVPVLRPAGRLDPHDPPLLLACDPRGASADRERHGRPVRACAGARAERSRLENASAGDAGPADALPAAAAIASVPASMSAASRSVPSSNYLRTRTTLATSSQYVQSYHPGCDVGARSRPLAGAVLDGTPRRGARRRGAREGRRAAPAVLVPRLDRPTAASHARHARGRDRPPPDDDPRLRPPTRGPRRRPQNAQSGGWTLVPPRPHAQGSEALRPGLACRRRGVRTHDSPPRSACRPSTSPRCGSSGWP